VTYVPKIHVFQFIVVLVYNCTCAIAVQTVAAWDRSLQLLVFRGSNSPVRPRVVHIWDPALTLECGSHLSARINVLAARTPAQDTDLPVVCGLASLPACTHELAAAFFVFC